MAIPQDISAVVGPYRIKLSYSHGLFEVVMWNGVLNSHHENYVAYDKALVAFESMKKLAAVYVAKRAFGIGKVTTIEDGDTGITITITNDNVDGTIKIT